MINKEKIEKLEKEIENAWKFLFPNLVGMKSIIGFKRHINEIEEEIRKLKEIN
jgi:hypothetical protein